MDHNRCHLDSFASSVTFGFGLFMDPARPAAQMAAVAPGLIETYIGGKFYRSISIRWLDDPVDYRPLFHIG
jgi:hypothetical protein